MILAEAPSMRPHVCVDGSQNGVIVDTGITHPVYGRMYWPAHLVRDAGRLIGLVEASERDSARAEAKTLAAKVAELEGELAELLPVRDAIDRAAGRFGEERFEPIERVREAA